MATHGPLCVARLCALCVLCGEYPDFELEVEVADRPDLEHVDVGYVADLARIALTDEEQQEFQRQLDDILEYVSKLAELDVAGIQPTAHAVPMVNVLREDIARPSMDREHVMRNAPASVDDAYVRVPAVIGEEH